VRKVFMLLINCLQSVTPVRPFVLGPISSLATYQYNIDRTFVPWIYSDIGC